MYIDLVDHGSMNSNSYYTGPYIPYYVSVAASTSIGKGDVKTKVAFTEQGGVYVCFIATCITMPFSFFLIGVQYQ